eukprot:TRINITY_DN146_c3_g1_i1.p1 TRINITY_DN146_c3_g1~~TRINITY_DN146_c3_g1_i1.p1  ORF type:complete len:363 (-),score=125.51 TRINITY_DN146_c3_g1_i1:285-1373(-)
MRRLRMVFDSSNVLSILVATLAISGAAYATYHFRTQKDTAQLSEAKKSTQSSESTKKKSKGRRKQRKGTASSGSEESLVKETEEIVVPEKKSEGKKEDKKESKKEAKKEAMMEKQKQEKGKVEIISKSEAITSPPAPAPAPAPEKKKSKKGRSKNKEEKKSLAQKKPATKAAVEERKEHFPKLEEEHERKELEEPVLASASRDADPSEIGVEDPDWQVVKRKGRRSTRDTPSDSDLDEPSAPVVPQPKQHHQSRTRSARRKTDSEEGKRPSVDDDPWDLGSAKEAASEQRVDVDAFLEEHYGRASKESSLGGTDSAGGRVRVSVEHKHQQKKQKDIWSQKTTDVAEPSHLDDAADWPRVDQR